MSTTIRSIPARRRTLGRVSSRVVAILVVVVGSAVIGGLTSPAQHYLPSSVNSLANSAGGWTAFAFLLVWLSRARPVLAVILGVVAFEVMVESYGIVSGWRGHSYAAPFSTVYALLGLVIGPAIGAAAAVVRHGSRGWRLAGVGLLSAILIADGAHGLLTVLDSTSPVFWSLEVIAGASFFAVGLIRWRRA